MNAPETHLDKPEQSQREPVACGACRQPFVPTRPWSRFCSTKCRNLFHQSLTPDALRRDIDALRTQVAELEAALARITIDRSNEVPV